MYSFISKKQKKEFSQSSVNINAVGIKDILFLFVAFSFVLYLLFPKETLKEKVLREEKSNDLALVYIENMIKFDYKNYELLLHYSDIQFKKDQFLSVKGIVEMLLKSDNKEIQRSALVLGEKLFKRQYFLLEEQELEHEEREQEREKLLKEYQTIIQDMVLISKDEKFQSDILSYFREQDDKSEYKKLLVGLSRVNYKWKIKLAEYYAETKLIKKALILYMKMLSEDIPHKYKKIVFVKTVDLLIYGGFFEDGTKIIEKYENIFSTDEKIFEQVIRFYLAANQPQKARRYILKREKY